MKKLTKLILTGGIFSSSLFFNPGYSQEYYTGNPNDPKSEIKRISKETWVELNKKDYSYWMKDAVDKNGVTKWYIVPKTNPKVTQPQNKPNTSKNIRNLNKELVDAANVNKTYTTKKKNPDFGEVLNTTNNTLNAVNSLLDLIINSKTQKNINYNAPPANNPPTNYNSDPEPKKNIPEWDWQDKKEKERFSQIKKTENTNWKDAQWWEDVQQEKADAKERADKASKELSDFVEKQAGYSPKTKIWFDEEYKKADEFYKEYYKNDPEAYAESQKRNKLEKIIGYRTYNLAKEYTPAGPVLEGIETYDELKKEEGWNKKYEESKKILGQPEEGAPENSFYYGTTKFQKDMKTGLYVAGEKFGVVDKIEGAIDIEKKIREESVKNWLNQQIKEEKEVDFLFAKPIGDNTYYYFKLVGKEELYKNYNESSKIASYIAIKNSPFGDQIINIAKDFKEKVEKIENWWDK